MAIRNRWTVLALSSLLLVGIWSGYILLAPYKGYAEAGIFVEVPRGAGTRGIAGILSDRGVVRSALAFEIFTRWQDRPLQAGEYYFDKPMTPHEVFRKLAEGRVFVIRVTFPEGASMFDVADILEKAGFAARQEFLAAAADPAPIRDLAPRARNLEGFLFPDTYSFPRRVSAGEIVATMVRRFREVWQGLAPDGRISSRYGPAELVTLASLVERETSRAAERPLVSGVYHNRLRRGMALQCDPTVIYALQLAGQYSGQLTLKDLRFPSPYNTYLRPGLPPGPIANPGEAALRAALAPPAVDYLYFVSDNQGGHFFSKTLAEHNANVARYRRLQAEAAKSAASRGSANGKRKR